MLPGILIDLLDFLYLITHQREDKSVTLTSSWAWPGMSSHTQVETFSRCFQVI